MSEAIRFLNPIPSDLRLKLLEEIQAQPEVWGEADGWAKEHYPYFAKQKTCIPLIAGKEPPYENTPFCSKFPTLYLYMTQTYGTLTRINIQKVLINGRYPKHVDLGAYFEDKDRHSLCLQGAYWFTVGKVGKKVQEGDVVWFDNKQPHEAVNISNKERIAIIFDVPKEI